MESFLSLPFPIASASSNLFSSVRFPFDQYCNQRSPSLHSSLPNVREHCDYYDFSSIFLCSCAQRQYEYQIKKQTSTTASPRISHTIFFFIQYCHSNLLDLSSNRFDYSLILRAFYEVCCRSYCLPYNKLMFSFMMSWMLYSSRFIRSTFFTEPGSQNSRFFSLIFRSNLMKYSSEVRVSNLDQQFAAVKCVLTQSKNGEMMESRKAAASLSGQVLSAMRVKTTQFCTLQKMPKEVLSMCLSDDWSLRLYCATSVRYRLTLCLTVSICSSMYPSLDSQKVRPSASLLTITDFIIIIHVHHNHQLISVNQTCSITKQAIYALLDGLLMFSCGNECALVCVMVY